MGDHFISATRKRFTAQTRRGDPALAGKIGTNPRIDPRSLGTLLSGRAKCPYSNRRCMPFLGSNTACTFWVSHRRRYLFRPRWTLESPSARTRSFSRQHGRKITLGPPCRIFAIRRKQTPSCLSQSETGRIRTLRSVCSLCSLDSCCKAFTGGGSFCPARSGASARPDIRSSSLDRSTFDTGSHNWISRLPSSLGVRPNKHSPQRSLRPPLRGCHQCGNRPD